MEKKIKKAVVVCFVTKEKMQHFDDKLGVSMIFAEPAQALSAKGNQVSLHLYSILLKKNSSAFFIVDFITTSHNIYRQCP